MESNLVSLHTVPLSLETAEKVIQLLSELSVSAEVQLQGPSSGNKSVVERLSQKYNITDGRLWIRGAVDES